MKARAFILSGALAPLVRNPQLGFVLVTIALVMLGNGLIAPILSVYAATFAASGTLVGLIITLFGVGRLLANMPAGILSERFGRRPLLILGPAILAIGAIGAALATSYETLLLWRFVQGIGSGIYMTVTAALLADISTDSDRGRIMALYQAGLLIGAGIGPAVGGMIAEHLGLTAPFWACAAACTVAVLTTLRSGPDVAYDRGDPEADAAVSGLSLLGNRLFLLICMVNFGVFFTRTASHWLLIPLLGYRSFGLGFGAIGLALAVMAVANFLTLPVAGELIDRLGASRMTIWSSVLTSAALVLVAAGASAGIGSAGFWLGMILLGIGSGLNGPAVAACAATAMPRRLYGPAMGLLRSCGDLGFILGPVMVGLLIDSEAVSVAGGILFNAAIVLLSTGAFFLGSMKPTTNDPAE